MNNNTKTNSSEDAWLYLFKIVFIVILFLSLVFVIGAYFLVPTKAENKISKRFSEVGITYSKVSCSGLLNIECVVNDVNSPVENGNTIINRLELSSVQDLKGFAVPNYTGPVKIQARGYGVEVVQGGLRTEVSSIIKNSFNNSNFILDIDIDFRSGVAERINLKNIQISLPHDYATFNVSVDVLDSNKEGYFNSAIVSAEFNNYKEFLVSLYRGSLTDLTDSEVKAKNLQNYNKEVISDDDVFNLYLNDAEKFANSSVSIENKDFHDAILDPEFKGATIIFTNDDKISIQALTIALASGSNIDNLLSTNIEVHK